MAKAIEFEIKIKGDSGVLKTFTLEATNADDAIASIVKSATLAEDKLRKMAESSLILDTATRAVKGLNDIVGGLVAPFNSFENAMRKANTMAMESEEGYEHLSEQIVQLSEHIPLLREEIADGLYQVISNGVPKDNWISFLEDSSKAAVGGVADLGQTVTVTSTLIKNYGLEWSAAGAIQDKIQTTARNGVTSFEELGQALPRVSGSASQLGVEINELMAVFATATGVTGNTSEVSTQLAAVLNSLIKPSSEASKAAAAMGIQFDAASVKACGGFRNFLSELDSSVTAYAQSSGQLSETIYGQLFGSAEALRLLGSLTGEQRDKFGENIDAMCDSAGAIEQAFGQMSSTGDAMAVKFSNQTQAVADFAGRMVSSIAPYLEFAANLGASLTTLAQIVKLSNGFGGILASITTAMKSSIVVQGTITAATKAWAVAQAALNAILTMNPIGIVIVAIGALVAAVAYAYNNSEEFRKICDQLWSTIKSLASAVWDFLVAAFEKASKVIQTAWEWVKKFFGITDAESATKVAGALDRQTDSTDGLAKANERLVSSGLKVRESVSWQKMSYDQLGAAIEQQKTKVAQLAGTNAANAKAEGEKLRQMEARYKALGRQFGLSDGSGESGYDGKSLIADAVSYKELGNNIAYYQNALDKTDPSEKDEIERLSRLIAGLKEAQESIRQLQESFSQPVELDSLSDIERAIQYQQNLRSNSSAGQLGNIDSEIKRLEGLRDAMELQAFSVIPVEEISSLRQLNEQREYYNKLYEISDQAGRESCRRALEELDRIEAGWRRNESQLREPVEIGAAGSINELSAAIAVCEERINSASAEEAAAWARTKRAYEEKREAMQRGIDAALFNAEAESINDINNNIAILTDRLNAVTSRDEAGQLNREIAGWKRKAEAMSKAGGAAEAYSATMEQAGKIMSSIGSITGGASKEWLNYGANVMATLGTVIPEMIKLLGVDQSISVAEAIKSGAGVPFPGNIFAIAAGVTAVMSAFAGIPKFAKGGIAYGPTLGIFGEYAGASTNPEVVAPLSELQRLMGPGAGSTAEGGGPERVELVVDGFKMKALIDKVNNLSRRR